MSPHYTLHRLFQLPLLLPLIGITGPKPKEPQYIGPKANEFVRSGLLSVLLQLSLKTKKKMFKAL